jgi:cbb3-type cytochrome oxidase subunit 3
MYKYILESAGSINWMAVFALITFFFVFSMSIYLAFVKDKASLQHAAELPLNDDTPSTH